MTVGASPTKICASTIRHRRFHVFFPRRLSTSIIDCAVSVW